MAASEERDQAVARRLLADFCTGRLPVTRAGLTGPRTALSIDPSKVVLTSVTTTKHCGAAAVAIVMTTPSGDELVLTVDADTWENR